MKLVNIYVSVLKIYVIMGVFLGGLFLGIILTLRGEGKFDMQQVGMQLKDAMQSNITKFPHHFFIADTNLRVTMRADGSGVIRIIKRDKNAKEH